MAKKKIKSKSIRERITVLEIKVDEEFFKKILSSFELYTVKMGEMSGKIGELIGKLEEMGRQITKINAKIFN